MSENEKLPKALTSLEAMLARLSPTESNLDRDRLMFEAGAASVGSASVVSETISDFPSNEKFWNSVRRWKLSTAAAALIACFFAALYSAERNQLPATVKEYVYVERGAEAIHKNAVGKETAFPQKSQARSEQSATRSTRHFEKESPKSEHAFLADNRSFFPLFKHTHYADIDSATFTDRSDKYHFTIRGVVRNENNQDLSTPRDISERKPTMHNDYKQLPTMRSLMKEFLPRTGNVSTAFPVPEMSIPGQIESPPLDVY